MTTQILQQQRTFAEAYVAGGGNATQAAISAGYSPVSARQTASRLLHLPHVQEAIRRVQAHTLRGRLASKALAVLERVLDDDGAPAGVRVDAAKTVLDRAGHVSARVPDDGIDDQKMTSEMTLEQLDQFIRQQERALNVLRATGSGVEDGQTLSLPTAAGRAIELGQ